MMIIGCDLHTLYQQIAACPISRVEDRVPIPTTSDENLSRLSSTV